MGVIFVLTYAGVALGRIPGLRLDRAGIALAGAAMTMANNMHHIDLRLPMVDLRYAAAFCSTIGVSSCFGAGYGYGPSRTNNAQVMASATS